MANAQLAALRKDAARLDEVSKVVWDSNSDVFTVRLGGRIDPAAHHLMEEDARVGHAVSAMIALTKKLMPMISKTRRSPVAVICSDLPRLAGYSPEGVLAAKAYARGLERVPELVI